MAENDCLDGKVLLAFHTGNLPEESAEEVIAHLSQCSTCQEALKTIEGGKDRQESLPHSPAGHREKMIPPEEKPDDGPSLEVFCRRLVESGLMTAEERRLLLG
jgi:anti-sigma factor RsiW